MLDLYAAYSTEAGWGLLSGTAPAALTDRRSAACGEWPDSHINAWEGLESTTPHNAQA